jgi:hypothetical protein
VTVKVKVISGLGLNADRVKVKLRVKRETLTRVNANRVKVKKRGKVNKVKAELKGVK